MHKQIKEPIDLPFEGRINTAKGKPLTYCRISLRKFKEGENNNYEICIVNLCRSDSTERQFMRFGNYYFYPETLGELYRTSINNGFFSEKYKRRSTDSNYLQGKIIFSTVDRICLEEQNKEKGATWRKTIFLDGPYIRTKVEENVSGEWVENQIPLCLPPEDFMKLMKEAQMRGLL